MERARAKAEAQGAAEHAHGGKSLEKDALEDCVSRKVKILIAEGKSQEQALAIAYSMCGEKSKEKSINKGKFTNPFPAGVPDVLEGNDLIRALQLDIASEYDAAALYTAHADKVANLEAKEVLNSIAREELVHVGEFQKLIDILADEDRIREEGATEVSEEIGKADHHTRFFLDKIHEMLKELDIDDETREKIIRVARAHAGGKTASQHRIANSVSNNKSDGKVEKSVYSPIRKVDEYLRLVTGVVLEPDSVDLQGDRISVEDIRKAMESYMINSQTVGLQHEKKADAVVVECYLAPCDFQLGLPAGIVRKGSWVLTTKILSDELWQKVLDGSIGGFSVGGTGIRTPE
jgi:rubrerythrin